MTRDEHLARLAALNAELERLGAEPTFATQALEAMTETGLRAAIQVTEDDLLHTARTLGEQ